MLHDHLEFIKWSLGCMSYLRCFPLVWDSSAGRVRIVRKRIRIIFVQVVEVLQLAYFGVMLSVIIKQATIGCTLVLLPSIRMLLATFLVFLWGMGVGTAKKAAVLLNTTIGFERWLQETFSRTTNVLRQKGEMRSSRNTFLRKVLLFSNSMCPIIAVTRIRRLMRNSCSPPYLGYALGYCTSCGEQVTEDYYLSHYGWQVIKTVVMFLDGYHIAVKVFKSFFLVFNVTLMTTGCMLDYLDLLTRMSLGMGISAKRRVGLTTRIKFYRCLQVLEKQFNNFGSSRVVPALMVVAPIVQVFCTFVLIKLARSLTSEGYITYPFIITICVMSCMFFETYAAQLGIKSKKLAGDWLMEKNVSTVNRKLLNSLQPIRIKVGSNFIDRGTALVTQDFCITQTVSLLLM